MESSTILETKRLKVLVILSGGLDSTTLLYDVLSQGYDVQAISFNYNQKHRKELYCAQLTCKNLGVPHKIVDLSGVSDLVISSLTRKDIDVPEGHYQEDSMKSTVVPNRNMVLLALAASYAISEGIDRIFYGAHAGDHAIYPDCRPEFVNAMRGALSVCDYYPVYLFAPYLSMTKGDIVKRGLGLGVDYTITWTCYNGRTLACGKCGSCTERLEAFADNHITDPLCYEPVLDDSFVSDNPERLRELIDKFSDNNSDNNSDNPDKKEGSL